MEKRRTKPSKHQTSSEWSPEPMRYSTIHIQTTTVEYSVLHLFSQTYMYLFCLAWSFTKTVCSMCMLYPKSISFSKSLCFVWLHMYGVALLHTVFSFSLRWPLGCALRYSAVSHPLHEPLLSSTSSTWHGHASDTTTCTVLSASL